MLSGIRGVNHVTLVVTDLSRSIAFYVEKLGFRLRARWARGAYLDGPTWLCLELGAAVARPDDSHLAFTVDALPALSVPTWKENRSEGASLYFLDPDGHKLELHVGDLASRLESCRERPYEDMELFD